MTATEITNYLVNEYGECKHDAYAMSEAINDMAEEIDADEWDLFHLLVENEPINNLIRSTNYISWNINITENAFLNNTAYYQLSASDMNDFRLLYEGGLEFELSEKLSFTVELNYRYDNDPHGNLGNSYIEINNGIEFNF